MSGGKDRKSKNKAQGWEEAGSEFYQESYPTDLEGAIQKDPSAIATLLPSKQNRFGKSIELAIKSLLILLLIKVSDKPLIGIFE